MFATIVLYLCIFAQWSLPAQPNAEKEREFYYNYSEAKKNCFLELMGNNTNDTAMSRMKIEVVKVISNQSSTDIGCFWGCVGKNLTLIDENGNVIDEKLRELSTYAFKDNHTIEEVYESCADLEKTYINISICEMGNKLFGCIIKEITDDD
ncbi:hypothetical protein FQR65_LT12562 [Abscondita terminalis]|nr:hypothetical protein FQR65_LT12562 [Abscondita terminalis]